MGARLLIRHASLKHLTLNLADGWEFRSIFDIVSPHISLDHDKRSLVIALGGTIFLRLRRILLSLSA